MENKELQKIIKELMQSQVDIQEIAKSGSLDISKMMSSLKALPEIVEKNMSKFPKEQQELLKTILKDAKEKTTEEYIYKEAL
jgi:cell fate (sporulation/competence/biofilm development) regulator YlbF (YheA/YmcA/DUF963 family)